MQSLQVTTYVLFFLNDTCIYFENQYSLLFFSDIIKNCWIKTKILSPGQAKELRTGVRHNNRAAPDENIGIPCEIGDELLEM